MERQRVCFHCGVRIERGGLAYQFRVQMAADFDGYIDGDSPDASLEAGARALTEVSERTAEELAEQVYRERTLLLCFPCAEDAWAAATEPGPRQLQ